MAGSRHLPLAPAAGFVLVWSSGYIAGPYGVEAMSPLMLCAVRFVLAALLAFALARALRGPLRVTRADGVRIALSGFVLNGVQFGAMYLAFDAGLGATLASLMHSLSPVLTALLAAAFLGERLSRLQVLGFVIGVAGVLLVLGPDVEQAGGTLGIVCGVVSVLGLSVGTLGQRWIGHAPDPLWSGTIQFGVAAPPLLVLALVMEGTDVVRDPAAAGIAVVYLAVVNSIIGLGLLGILVRARGAGAAASVFFLMPPVTAVLAWLILGETLNTREIAGLVITVVGVAAATRSARIGAPEPVGGLP
jgi:drug/metabolite transporter (DMT)-like permease